MPTVTLLQNAQPVANILSMRAQPMGVILTGLTGGAAVFQCTNPLASIARATSVDIVNAAPVNPVHQTIHVSSVIS